MTLRLTVITPTERCPYCHTPVERREVPSGMSMNELIKHVRAQVFDEPVHGTKLVVNGYQRYPCLHYYKLEFYCYRRSDGKFIYM